MITSHDRRHPTRSYYRARVAAPAVLLTVAAAWVLAHEGHQALPVSGVLVDAAKGTVTLAPAPRAALDVRTAEVTEDVLPEGFTAPATLEAPWQRHAFAAARAGGKVAALHVRPGQAVAEGQLLAEVESLELDALQLELLAARTEARLTAQNLRALEAASKEGSVSDRALRDYRAKQRADENALEVARRKLFVLGVPEADVSRLVREDNPAPLRTLPVHSPIAGVVLHVDARVGQVVEPADHLAEVVDTAAVWVRVAVLEKDLRLVSVGQPVEVRLAAYPDPEQVFRTTVRSKGLALDSVTHQAAVRAELANGQGLPMLLPGMAGEARLLLPGSGRRLTVPEDALLRDGAETFVLVEEGPGQYLRRNVVPGRSAGGRVEIHSPQLYPGDRVVMAGGHELAALFVRGTFRISPEAAEAIGLRVEPAHQRPVAEVAELSGAVELPPERRAVVSPRLTGTVFRIRVEPDQAVRAGDVLAEVASAEFQGLQLELLRNQLELAVAEDALASLRAAAPGGSVPERQLRDVEAAALTARQRRDGARRKLEAVGLSAGDVRRLLEKGEFAPALPVRSPVSGNVVRFPAVLGQAVKAQEPLCEVHDLTGTAVRAFVPERLLGAVREGQRARVRFVADPVFVPDAVLARSDRAVSPDGRVLSVWADLAKPPTPPLPDGALARLAVEVGEPVAALAVPRDAVLWEGTQPYVFVPSADGTFERRAVRTGRSGDRLVEITDGLHAGEHVAVAGVAGLQNAYATVK
jgi:RND family efflux transporter MFP subunit